MKYPELVPATFLERPTRFVALVRLADGATAKAYVPTTGRLTKALEPGCRVWLARSDSPHRKTAYTMALTELPNGGYCGVQAVLANRLFAEAVASGMLPEFCYQKVEAEVSVGNSRLDFRLSSETSVCWVEIKSVTYASNGVDKFPDTPTGRGRKHLDELAHLAATGDRASVVFIVQREDVQAFTPFEEIDPEFTASLRVVHRQGVAVHAFRCITTRKEITIHQEIPAWI